MSPIATASAPEEHGPWVPPFLTLPIHAVIAHQLDLALNGVENSILVGPRGAGKTEYVTRRIGELRKLELLRDRNGGARARQILYYASAAATGSKTVLTDVYSHLTGQTLGKRSKQDWTPTQFIGQIVLRAREDNVCLLVIDEAQFISSANIEHLRQLCDRADQEGHSFRVVLIGNDGLTQVVAATGELGERFATEIRVPTFSAGQVKPYLLQFHPDLPAIAEALGSKEWAKLEHALFAKAAGSFRRFHLIIVNAHQFARRLGRRMTAEDLKQAIEKLADDR